MFRYIRIIFRESYPLLVTKFIKVSNSTISVD